MGASIHEIASAVIIQLLHEYCSLDIAASSSPAPAAIENGTTGILIVVLVFVVVLVVLFVVLEVLLFVVLFDVLLLSTIMHYVNELDGWYGLGHDTTQYFVYIKYGCVHCKHI